MVSTKARTRKGREGREEEGETGREAEKRNFLFDGNAIYRNREPMKNIIQLIKEFSKM